MMTKHLFSSTSSKYFVEYAVAISFFLLSSSFACNTQTIDSQIGLFDISSNDQNILFSFYKEPGGAIYQMDTAGKDLKLIIPSKRGMNYFNPKYAKKGDKILFIGRRNDVETNNSAIYLANSDGSDVRQLTDGKEDITEAIFSDCEDKIYYSSAKEYGHASPLGSNQPHGLDIYSIDLYGKQVRKITNLNLYGIFRISEYDCNSLLIYVPLQEDGGMIKILKNKPNDLIRINPTNNPRSDLSMYYVPAYSIKYNTLVFIATYQIMQMNMNDRVAKTVVDQNDAKHSQVNNVVLLHDQKKMIYTTKSETQLVMVDYDGSNRKNIAIPLDKMN